MHRSFNFTAPNEYFLKGCPELLYIQYDKGNRNTLVHAHDFWQFEMAVSGLMEARSSGKKIKATAHDCILIPPGIPHRIAFKGKTQSAWSVKFKMETNKTLSEILLLSRSRDSINIRKNIWKVLEEFSTNSNSCVILQYLLGMLIELEFQQGTINDIPDVVSQVKELIDSHEGRPVTINELAEQLNCSRNNLSQKFHASTGIQLKNFIDSRRIETATRMLLYSDQKIIAISEIMGFPDVYSFSRFFRRLQGCSPRQYRNENK